MRLIRLRLVWIERTRTQAVTDQTGGISRQETDQVLRFLGHLLPPQKRVARAENGVRLAMTWKLLAQGFPDLEQQDVLRLPPSPRTFVITALRRWPCHLEADLEAAD